MSLFIIKSELVLNYFWFECDAMAALLALGSVVRTKWLSPVTNNLANVGLAYPPYLNLMGFSSNSKMAFTRLVSSTCLILETFHAIALPSL